jgi:hypothetical protein
MSCSILFLVNYVKYIPFHFIFQGRGYWYTYPSIPLGPSADKKFMAKDEARYTAVYEFDNNVAHSYRNVSHELVTW